jgi:hypothetical protein
MAGISRGRDNADRPPPCRGKRARVSTAQSGGVCAGAILAAMNTHRPTPAETIARCRAAIASCRVWLCETLLWIAECFGGHGFARGLRAELEDNLRHITRGVRAVLVLLAVQRNGLPPHDARAPHILRAPRGFARPAPRGSDLRHVTRRVKFYGRDLRARFARLRAIIDTLDACAARVAPVIAHGPRQRAPRAVRPPAIVLRALARVAAAISDTS